LRPATRAGQNAIAIQMIAIRIHHKINMTCPLRVPYGTLLRAAELRLRHRVFARERSPVHPRFPGKAVDR
jgi:hypothetical protein